MRFVPLALFPFATGCIVIQQRRSLFDLDGLAAPLTDSGLTGWLLLVASCSGVLGGVVAWLLARSRKGRTAPQPSRGKESLSA